MRTIKAIAVLFSLVLAGCSSQKSTMTQEQRKQSQQELKKLLTDRGYEVNLQYAHPLTSATTRRVTNDLLSGTGDSANRINVSDSGDYIKVSPDSARGQLSFVGEKRTPSYPVDPAQGIFFDGMTRNYRVTELDKQQLDVKYSIQNNDELYDVHLKVNPDSSVTVFINSTDRDSMRYTGQLKKLEDSE